VSSVRYCTSYTADIPTSTTTTTIATFADDTAVLATDSDPAVASQKLQNHLLAIEDWLQKFQMQANAPKSVHVTFTTLCGTCPPVHMNKVQIPCEDHVKYLGLHLDRKLSWQHHFFTKRTPRGVTLNTMYWLRTASTFNIEIQERFQVEALRMIDAPWYVPNTLIRRDLQIPTVKEKISHYNSHYSALLTAHPIDILLTLFGPPERKRLPATPVSKRYAN
jgi:hypothetical protein